VDGLRLGFGDNFSSCRPGWPRGPFELDRRLGAHQPANAFSRRLGGAPAHLLTRILTRFEKPRSAWKARNQVVFKMRTLTRATQAELLALLAIFLPRR
jgi:hypothetical protein